MVRLKADTTYNQKSVARRTGDCGFALGVARTTEPAVDVGKNEVAEGAHVARVAAAHFAQTDSCGALRSLQFTGVEQRFRQVQMVRSE